MQRTFGSTLVLSDHTDQSSRKTSHLRCWHEESLRNHHCQCVSPGSFPSLISAFSIPDEHSRVKLPEIPGDPLSFYINANYVHGWSNDYHAFIATQGPLANTIVDFYRMIWQEHAPVIVMITRLFEKNKVRR